MNNGNYKVRTLPKPKFATKPHTVELKEAPIKQDDVQSSNQYKKDKIAQAKSAMLHKNNVAVAREHILLVAQAIELHPDNPKGDPQREARLYMFVPSVSENIPYDSIMWDKVSYRLEVYDYRKDLIEQYCKQNKTYPLHQEGRFDVLATAFEFDANGQHREGYGTMDLITMPILSEKAKSISFLSPIAEEAAKRGEFHFSLKSDVYKNGHAELGIADPTPTPVFALSLRGPKASKTKDYAVTRNNKLYHADADEKNFFLTSEPFNFSAVIKAIKDKTPKK